MQQTHRSTNLCVQGTPHCLRSGELWEVGRKTSATQGASLVALGWRLEVFSCRRPVRTLTGIVTRPGRFQQLSTAGHVPQHTQTPPHRHTAKGDERHARSLPLHTCSGAPCFAARAMVSRPAV